MLTAKLKIVQLSTFACSNINCLFWLRLKNGDWKFFNSLDESEKVLLNIDIFFNVFVIGLFTYSSSYKEMFSVVGILRIQIQSLQSVFGDAHF